MKKVRRLYHCSYARVSVPERELDALEAALAEAVELLERFSKASAPQAYYGQYSIRLATKAFLGKHGRKDEA